MESAAGRACVDNVAEHPRGILVVSVDALRPDRLSPYGGQVAMPALDLISGEGVRLDDLATTSTQARPAALSMLTGLGPDRTEVRDDQVDRVPADAPTVARQLSTAGWATAAFVSTPLVSYGSGFDEHFDLFDGPQELVVGPARYVPPNRPAEELVENVERWASGLNRETRWFAWVHLGHLGSAATSRNLEETTAAWDETAAALDAVLGRLRAVALSRSVATEVDLIVVGTYGVLLDERDGASGSAFWLTPETIRTAGFHARYRDGAALGGSSVDHEPRWLPDIAATVRTLSGVGGLPGSDGVPLDEGASSNVRQCRRAWTWAPDDQVAWPPLTAVETDGGWVAFPWTDLAAVAEHATPERRFAAERPARPRGSGGLPPEARRRLVELGFELGPDRMFAAQPPDAAVRNDLLRGLQRLRQHFVDRRERASGLTSGRLLEAYPDDLGVLVARMFVLLQARALEPAEEVQRTLLREHPARQEALHWAAHLELLLDRGERASALLDAVRALGPVEPEVLYDIACLRAVEGDRDAAFAELRAAIEAGFRNWDWIERDADLASLRADPEYSRLLAEHGR